MPPNIGDPPGADTLGNIARLRGLQAAQPGAAGARQYQAAGGHRRRPNLPRAPTAAARWPRRARTPPPATGKWRASTWHRPFPLYPHGFPPEIMSEFERRIGRRSLGNKAASGTEIIKELGAGAHAHRLAHRLHLRRQRLPGGRARRGHPALGALQDLRNRARDSARAARSGARHRAAVHRRAGQFHAHRQPSRLRRAAAQGHAARPARQSAASRSTAWARFSTCSWAAASANRPRPRTTPTAWRRRSRP